MIPLHAITPPIPEDARRAMAAFMRYANTGTHLSYRNGTIHTMPGYRTTSDRPYPWAATDFHYWLSEYENTMRSDSDTQRQRMRAFYDNPNQYLVP